MNEYVNNCDMQRYADDTQLRISFNKSTAFNMNNELMQSLNSVYKYSQNNGLKLNANKSAVIFFGPNSEWAVDNVRVLMAEAVIPVVKEYKNLGIIFDATLRFRSQVGKVVQKSYLALRNLYKSKHILRPHLKKSLCEALVLSLTNYCNFVYGPCLDLQCKNRLQRIQNSCIRFIYGLRGRDHVSHKLPELKWLKIIDRQKLHFACFLHQLLKTGIPQYLREKLQFRYSTHSRTTRNNNLLNIPKHRTALFQRSFSYMAPKMYNANILSSNLENLSPLSFKLKYRRILLDKYL